MATRTISHAVGAWDRGAKNAASDVKVIQQLLQIIASNGRPQFYPGPDDGKIARAPGASATLRAILAFQGTWMRKPDGLVSPGKETLRRLNEEAEKVQKARPSAARPVPAAPVVKPAPTPTILGIHSNVAGDRFGYTDGHAWLTITQNGATGYYGLWPDAHPNVVNNGNGTDIRMGMESGDQPMASRYYKLSPAQANHFWALMRANVAWRYTNTCASWATEVVEDVIGEDLDADDHGGFETPRELGQSILGLEKREPTSFHAPKAVVKPPDPSSW